MKRKIALIQMALVLSLATMAQSHLNPPESVVAAFNKKFPQATNVHWSKENSKEYEAEFSFNGLKTSANFLKDGTWIETETEIAVDKLPTPVVESIHKKYPDGVITEAEMLEDSKGQVFYELMVKSKNRKHEKVLNAKGEFIK